MDELLLQKLDRLVSERRFPNRSRAIQDAVREKIERIEDNRLAQELSKLDRTFERQFADEGMGDILEVSEY